MGKLYVNCEPLGEIGNIIETKIIATGWYVIEFGTLSRAPDRIKFYVYT